MSDFNLIRFGIYKEHTSRAGQLGIITSENIAAWERLF